MLSTLREFGPIDLASPDETEGLGARLGSLLEAGDYLALIGPIGAGKTTLARGITMGAGSPTMATSPSFVLLHEHSGSPPVLHADLYRLTDPREADDLGLLEQADELGAALAVEWPERYADAMPSKRLEIHIAFTAHGRQILLRAHGARAARLAEGLVAP